MSNKTLYLFIVFLAPLVGMGVDILAPSLPAIDHFFHTAVSLAKLSIPFYLFSYGLLQLIFGPWSDSRGRKPILLLGMIVYILATLLIIFSDNIIWFLGLRFIQGVGAAAVSVIIRAIIVDSLDGKALHKAFATFNMAWGVSPIAAPFIGGQLQHFFGWQASFIFLLTYSSIGAFLVIFLLKESKLERQPFQLRNNMKSYRQMLTSKNFVLGGVLLLLGYSSMIYFNIAGPFYIQEKLRLTSQAYGGLALLIGTAYFIGSSLNRQLLHKCKVSLLTQWGVVSGLVISIVFAMTAILLPNNLLLFIVPVFIIIFSLGFVQSNIMVYCAQQFPEKAGTAGAVIGFMLIAGAGLVNMLTSLQVNHGLLTIASSYLFMMGLSFILFLFLRDHFKFKMVG